MSNECKPQINPQDSSDCCLQLTCAVNHVGHWGAPIVQRPTQQASVNSDNTHSDFKVRMTRYNTVTVSLLIETRSLFCLYNLLFFYFSCHYHLTIHQLIAGYSLWKKKLHSTWRQVLHVLKITYFHTALSSTYPFYFFIHLFILSSFIHIIHPLIHHFLLFFLSSNVIRTTQQVFLLEEWCMLQQCYVRSYLLLFHLSMTRK